MIKHFRQTLMTQLWNTYCSRSKDCQLIADKLIAKGAAAIYLDHFAIIDLPSPQSGIPQLQRLLELLGYGVRGCDYLPKNKMTLPGWQKMIVCNSQLKLFCRRLSLLISV